MLSFQKYFFEVPFDTRQRYNRISQSNMGELQPDNEQEKLEGTTNIEHEISHGS